MANWAYTDYVIEGSEEALKRIQEAIEKHPVQKDSADNWEGNILHALNIDFENMKINDKELYMRGFLQEDSVELWEGTLRFCAEEAWGATDFAVVLNTRMKDIKVFYSVVEEGCEVYATNDKESKYFKDRWCIDACFDGNYDSDYFTTQEAALAWLERKTDGRVKTMEDIEKFNSDYEDSGAEDETSSLFMSLLSLIIQRKGLEAPFFVFSTLALMGDKDIT